MENSRQLRMRVREARTQQQLSVEATAAKLGISADEYRAYEEGAREAPFSFYYNVAETFGLDISSMIRGESPNLSFYTVTRSGEGFPLARRPGFSYLHRAIRMKQRFGEPFIVTAPPAPASEALQYSRHGGQEFVLILDGAMRVFLRGAEELLRTGDSIYFDGREAHAMRTVGDTPCRFLSIVMHGKEEKPTAEHFAEISEESALPRSGRCARRLLCDDYMDAERNPDGTLKKIRLHVPETFNFAYDVLARLARESPEKIAMRWLSKKRECRDFTFRDISENSMRVAGMLQSLGVRKGDRVMLVLKRHYQFWFALNALHMIGAVAVPASCQMTAHDFEYRFRKAEVRCVIASSDGGITDEIDAAAGEVPVAVKLVVNGKKAGWLDFDGLYPGFAPEFPRPADLRVTDPMLVFFSSGTTGYPKMVEHDFSYPLGHIVTARYWHQVDPDGLHFTVADTGWGKALWGKIYGQWLCEAGVFTYDFDRFHAAELLPMFKQYGITTFCAPPTIFRFMIKEDLSSYDFSTLEHVTTAGEAMPAEVSEAFARVSGQLPFEGFGQTETTLTIATLEGMKPKPGSMGRANPQFELALLDPDGKPVAPGETGEICIRIDGEGGYPCGLFRGYLNADAETDRVRHDGYYHTGDQAWQDEDGYFWYEGRADDIIKSSGYRIGPFEVESVLMELPYILECAVTGAPDPVRGQVVKASIVLVKGKRGSDELAEEIKEYVKLHTAPYKYPRIVEFVPELPKTVNGKIRRSAIREENRRAAK